MTTINVANHVEINELLDGAFLEAIHAEIERVAQNMADPNTVAVQSRKVKIELSMKPNVNREVIDVDLKVSSSCNSHNPPMKTTLLMSFAPGYDGVLHVVLAEHQPRQSSLFEAEPIKS